METVENNVDSNDESRSVVVASKASDGAALESSIKDEGGESSERSSSDAVAKGISSVLAAVIKDFDSKAQDTLRSQDHLSSSIDRLTEQLDQLLEDAPSPFIMQHAARISSVRKRVTSLNAVLRSIQRRRG